MAKPAQVREQAMQLPEEERAKLARDLLHSLDGEPDPDVARGWAEIVERRAREVLDGTAQVVDGREALARVRERLTDRRE